MSAAHKAAQGPLRFCEDLRIRHGQAALDHRANNAAMLARGDDASFQNKVHLAMQAKESGTASAVPDDET